MKDSNQKLLNALAAELNNAEDVEEASLFTADELGTEMDMVRCLVKETGADLLDTLAEFFYLPLEEDSEISYFTTMITVIDEMEPDDSASLSDAVARINFFLPVGAFAIDDADKGLVYKYAIPVMNDISDADKMRSMRTAFNVSLGVVDKYEGYLMLVATGELDPDKMMDLVLGR